MHLASFLMIDAFPYLFVYTSFPFAYVGNGTSANLPPSLKRNWSPYSFLCLCVSPLPFSPSSAVVRCSRVIDVF
ncbi:hypothetical protein F4809DRAFT_595459 [Biscogniauxia mediterranea]|nr:hypothetical protein F4809DRAFT_595459 [Biscogniauxia mediterranea]